jgi:hypothetical protein
MVNNTAGSMTRTQYMDKLRSLLAEVKARISAEHGGEYSAFCWAYSKRYEFFFAERQPRRLHAIVRDIMLDWDIALQSEADFEAHKERLGSARAMLEGIAKALTWDIPDFAEAMRAEAKEEAERLRKHHPQFQTVALEEPVEQGIDALSAAKMMAELHAETEFSALEIQRLHEKRCQARFGQLAVTRLAELRVFFDNEASSSSC